MNKIVKIVVVIGTILLFMTIGVFGVAAEEPEFYFTSENSEYDTVEMNDYYLASSQTVSAMPLSVLGDHGDGCTATNGTVRLLIENVIYWIDCECVDLDITSSVSVHVYRFTEDLPSSVLESLDTQCTEDFPDAVKLFNATEDYNCHSYAWYNSNVDTNNYWMDDPSPYISSGLYRRKTYASEGDIICYYDNEGDIKHSGIVVSGGLVARDVLVQSKWGPAGVYEHYATECEYPTNDIVYYERINHRHTHTGIYNVANQKHGWLCTDSSCGQIIWTDDHFYRHDFISTGSVTTHISVCACGDTITEPHSFTYQDYNEYYHKGTCACGYVTYKTHNYEYSYTNAQTHTKTCTLCDASYQDPHYEEAYSVEDNGDGSHDITCICEGIFEEDASHVYNEYDYYNGVYHKISCICGDYELEAHDMEYNSLDNSYHWEECWICGYENEVEHVYTASNTYYDLNHHKSFCACGNYEIALHDEYTIKSSNTVMHTLQLSCCGNRTVTNWHTYEEYDADSHTGDCTFCNYTLTVDQVHTENYMDNGNGTHTNKCHHCGYTHTTWHDYTYYALNEETHQRYCTKCDLEQIVEDHTWDDAFDEDGNWYPFCTGCGYELDVELLSLDMIDKLPGEIQSALQSAPQNALQSTQADGTETAYYVIQIDDNTGILYLNGEYYLVHYPEIPDVELEPTPSIPGEESVS